MKTLKLFFECVDDKGVVYKTADFLLFNDLMKAYNSLTNDEKLDCRLFYTIGSRSSGKTHSFMIFICMLFLLPEKQIIVYVFRKTNLMLTDYRIELFNKLETFFDFIPKQGNGENYNAAENILTNGKSKIIFKALNHEKMKISTGGGVGLPVWKDADAIIAHFEECTQMDDKLMNITKQSLKGGPNTQIIQLHSANPWSPLNDYVKKLLKWLPEDETELLTKGFQKRVFFDEELKQNVYVLRNNVLTNPHLDTDIFNELNSHKNKDINFWKIVFLGVAGVLGSTIYAHNMKFLKEPNYDEIKNEDGFFQGGLDWGDGSSAGASPTTCHFGKISTNKFFKGVSILNEKTIWNNKGTKHSTNEQIDEVIIFFKNCLEVYKRPFRVFIDSAALADFSDMFNSRLHFFGLSTMDIEFRKCVKISIEKRIETFNYMMTNDMMRIDSRTCIDLITALTNSHWVEQKEEREGFKRVRNHDETHWINSVEYLLDEYIWEFANLNKWGNKWI